MPQGRERGAPGKPERLLTRLQCTRQLPRLVPCAKSVTVEKNVLCAFVLFLLWDQSNESYFLFNNKFITCLKILMTRDFLLAFLLHKYYTEWSPY